MTDSMPYELRPLDAAGVAEILGCQPRTVLERYACLPDFPPRFAYKPAQWIARDILAYRETLKVGRPSRRRLSGSKSSVSAGHDGR